MKLVAHGSPLALEAELLDRVAAAKASDPIAPVLIVVPSRRLAEHVTGRLVERFGALLGVSVLHHRALAERIVEQAGAGPARLLEDDLLDRLFAMVVRRAPPGLLRDFVRDHPGAAVALRKTLTDLREAGIEPEAAASALSGAEAETAALYTLWSAALSELERSGKATDDAGLARGATRHAAAFGARFSSIVHHGAYDLIGVRVDLLRELDRGRELTFLLPADPEDASGRFGIERARLIASPQAPPASADRAIPSARVAFLHAQGARAELQTAAYQALAAVAAGTPPHDVAIVVRSFGPYTAALDALFDAGGPRWDTSYTRPLRRDPRVATALRAIAAAADRGPCSFRAHADEFEATARDHAANERLSGSLEAMRDIERVLGEDRAVSRHDAIAWLDGRVDATSVPPDGAEGGGVRILDVMQARGVTFTHLGLCGMNTGIFPRVAREDPFLANRSRAHLRAVTGRPLPIAAESDGEERLLLASLLRSASETVQVSWRRADEAARPLVPSLALREIARFAGRRPDAIEREARALPAHPRSRLEAWAEAPGLLGRGDELLLAALASERGANAGPAVTARRAELEAGVALVAATETFAPTSGAYDGRIGVSALRDTITASAFETLGRCPLQFFFRFVLRVVPPMTPPTPFEADAASTGSRVHEVLREVYARLSKEGAFANDDAGVRIARAREILKHAWDAPAGGGGDPRAARLPVLAGIERRVWIAALSAFLDADLRRMAQAGLVPEALEQDVERAIAGGPPGVVVRARFDRVLRGPENGVVGDYKTGRNLAERVKPGAMLSGSALQVPIYALISGLPVELLGVGPGHDHGEDSEADADVARFDRFKSAEERDGVLETLRVAASLAAAGRFPIHRGGHCDWCDYRSACRRGHPPTEFREERSADVRDARDCWRKTAKLPTLAAVRGEAAP